MTVLEALAILEAATFERKRRRWIRQSYEPRSIFWSRIFNRRGLFRSFATTSMASEKTSMLREKVNKQIFRVTFPGIRNSVRTLIGKQADALARAIFTTHTTWL